MFEGFTGYLLPYDQTAYWATVVGDQHQRERRRSSGRILAQILQGGAEIGPDTLARFYSLHMLVVPGRDLRPDRPAPLPRHPPRRHLAAVVEGGRRAPSTRAGAAAAGARRARRARRTRGRPTRREHEAEREPRRRAARSSQRYKEDVKKRGKPFYPYAMFHDTVMSLVVVVVIIALAVRLEVHDAGRPHRHGRRLARPALRGQGRPGDDELRAAARTGTSTSSSTCCGSSSGRTR